MDSIFDVYARVFRRLFGNKRLLVLIGMASGIFAVLTLFSEPFLIYFDQFMNLNLSKTSIPITFLLISLASFAIIYLQSGSGGASGDTSDHRMSERFYREIESNKRRIIELKEELSRQAHLQSEKKEGSLSDEERTELIERIVKESGEDTIKAIFDDRVSELKDSLEKESSFERIVTASEDIVSRLKREISDLRLRSNINLVLGMLITLGGLYLLWTTVSIVDTSDLLKQLASEGEESNYKFLKNLILPLVPRFLLVIFVEIFAYFFLRLYRDGLSEIKYFQNELTNAESKLAAVEFAFVTGTQESLKEAIAALSKTERNFVLEKGQTTVELERAKSESELTKNIIKTIPELFKKANK